MLRAFPDGTPLLNKTPHFKTTFMEMKQNSRKSLLAVATMLVLLGGVGCRKSSELVALSDGSDNSQLAAFAALSLKVDGVNQGFTNYYAVRRLPVIRISFNDAVKRSTVASSITLTENSTTKPVNYSYANGDSVVIITPQDSLKYITKYLLSILSTLKSTSGKFLSSEYHAALITTIDSSDKFPILTETKLLNAIEKQTFNYFWVNGHPVSGMARERNNSYDLVTTGGTGFGIMAIPAAIKRNYITRAEGLARVTKIANFLDVSASKYHGAFAHWLNGYFGTTIPFSTYDNGADLVETSYLMEGLLTARQYFNGSDTAETGLRATITKLWENVEWDWFTQGGQNVLYWHWSPNYGWTMNVQVRGWNEALITYIMAASSPTHPINKSVYTNGWAINGAIKNGSTYYGVQLPLGPSNGGPLFFEHYTFLGVNPNGLKDAYADYQQQTLAHTLINYNYCVANPKKYNGYSSSCWGLTASDDNISGYAAHEPNNDPGVISPTAAACSLPYTPTQSLEALKFFYYKLGDKMWGPYGFYDAFNLTNPWFATSTLAIDQMPIVVMIENYRSKQIWNLFSGCPEVKKGMRKLGFTAPYL